MYASSERLYVANRRWIDRNDFGAEDARGVTTHIHRFDVSGSDGPAYEASGSVDGFLLNQFAMSEHEGYLRVASTDTPVWGWWRQDGTSVSRVDVLQRDGAELRLVGSVGGLGQGERIYAVRFIGDIGYVVTFRQIDPLYTVDLSDPSDPRVVGELKIPGYSAYLHPIGKNVLLGVGQDADELGRVLGTQVSVFDVSDLANPVRTHQFKLPRSSQNGGGVQPPGLPLLAADGTGSAAYRLVGVQGRLRGVGELPGSNRVSGGTGGDREAGHGRARVRQARSRRGLRGIPMAVRSNKEVLRHRADAIHPFRCRIEGIGPELPGGQFLDAVPAAPISILRRSASWARND